jgi:hypothetical protein
METNGIDEIQSIVTGFILDLEYEMNICPVEVWTLLIEPYIPNFDQSSSGAIERIPRSWKDSEVVSICFFTSSKFKRPLSGWYQYLGSMSGT